MSNPFSGYFRGKGVGPRRDSISKLPHGKVVSQHKGAPRSGGYGKMQVAGGTGKVYSKSPVGNIKAIRNAQGRNAVNSRAKSYVTNLGKSVYNRNINVGGLKGTAHRFAGHIVQNRGLLTTAGGVAALGALKYAGRNKGSLRLKARKVTTRKPSSQTKNVQKKPGFIKRHIRVRRDAKGRFAGSY